MPELKVRKIDFQFDNDIDYYWNKNNLDWNNFVNYITLIAPAFEKYFIRATRASLDLINDSSIKKEAELFCFQEAQHSKHHISHLKIITDHYPELQNTVDKINTSYEQLFEKNSMRFHLAYAAIVECCFGPFAKFIINNIDHYFSGSDSRIASFILWHLVEEFEHRNAANDVYKAAVSSHSYRLLVVPKVIKHLVDVAMIAIDGLNQHVESFEGKEPANTAGLFSGVKKSDVLVLFYELACTLLPYHNPDNIKQPEWVSQWFADESAGKDMRLYYSA